MNTVFFMLSPYITLAFLLSVMLQNDKWVTLLTPITWMISIVGFIILFYRRYLLDDPLTSEIFFAMTGVDTDYPQWIIKSILIIILFAYSKKWTYNGLLLAICICTIYLFMFDFRKIYGIR